MWNITTQPWPSGAAVISGVPSASCAQFLFCTSLAGSASTCRVTVTSDGTSRPLNGLWALKGARCWGADQAMALPR